jgi:hypothetical protein
MKNFRTVHIPVFLLHFLHQITRGARSKSEEKTPYSELKYNKLFVPYLFRCFSVSIYTSFPHPETGKLTRFHKPGMCQLPFTAVKFFNVFKQAVSGLFLRSIVFSTNQFSFHGFEKGVKFGGSLLTVMLVLGTS